MLKLLVNKKLIEINNFDEKISAYDQVLVDLGTGNGKFIYDMAAKDEKNLYIGIEPTAENLFEYSKKTSKNKIRNLVFLISSIENLGSELDGKADMVYVNFPWGTLLEAVVKDMPELLRKISNLGKEGSVFSFTFAYSNIHEPSEIEKRALPLLSEDYLHNQLRDIYKKAGLEIESCTNLSTLDIKNFGSFWAKKLFLGKNRDVFRIISKKS